MNQNIYEVCDKHLKKCLNKAERCARMIDPKDLVEGHEHLENILCKSCKKIVLTTTIKECS